jgi:hypothetical protein
MLMPDKKESKTQHTVRMSSRSYAHPATLTNRDDIYIPAFVMSHKEIQQKNKSAVTDTLSTFAASSSRGHCRHQQ